jgi:hypothetical protein
MKKLLLLLVFVGLFIQSPLFAQSDSTVLFKRNKSRSESLYIRKLEHYRKMKSTGMTAAILGSALSIAGFIILTNDVNSHRYSNNNTGSTLFLIGLPLGITGSILWPIGAHKEKKYKKKLQGMSLNFNYSPHQQGLSFTYRF